MTSSTLRRHERVMFLVIVGLGLTITLIALSVGVGWIDDLPRLTSWKQGRIPMSPAAAVLSGLIGLSIGLSASSRSGRLARLVAIALAAVATIAAAGLFAVRMRGLYLPAELLGLTIAGSIQGAPIGYIATATAAFFMIAGGSLAVWLARRDRLTATPWSLLISGAAVMGAGLTLVLVDLTSGTVPFGVARITPAVNTAVCLLLIGLAQLIIAARTSMAAPSPRAAISTSQLLLSAFFGVISVTAGLGGYVFYTQTAQTVRDEAEDELTTISELRQRELQSWRTERLWDATQTFLNDGSSDEVIRLLSLPSNAPMPPNLAGFLQRFLIHADYDRVLLLDTAGHVRRSLPEDRDAGWAPPTLVRDAMAALTDRRVALSDFYLDADGQQTFLALSIPIVDRTPGRERPLAVLCLRVTPMGSLYPIIREWPSVSESAESLLVRRDGDAALFLSSLKFDPQAAVQRRAGPADSGTLAFKAVHGARGVVTGVNYRGAPVLGVIEPVADSPWLLIVQIDQAELNGTLRARLYLVITFVGVLLFGAAAGVGWIWQRQQAVFDREHAELSGALRDSAERLRLAVAAGDLGIWDMDVPTGAVVASPEYARILGHDPDTFQETHAAWSERLHPEDRTRVLGILAHHLEGRSAEYRAEYREATRSGDWKWVLSVGRLVSRSPDGHPLRMLGTITDISERKQAELVLRRSEEALRRSTTQLRGLLQNSPTVIYTMRAGDNEFAAFEVSENIERIFGFTREEALVHSWWLDHIAPDDRAKAITASQQLRERDDVTHEFRFLRKDGTTCWIQDTLHVVARDGATPRLVVGAWTDITERKHAELRSQRLSELYHALSDCDHAIVRSSNDLELFEAVCHAAVDKGGLSMAWVGLHDEATGHITPVAAAGVGTEYLNGLRISTRDHDPLGLGPTGSAVRENRPVWSDDFAADPATAPWHARGQEFGWLAAGALPLTRDGRPIGALTIYIRAGNGLDTEGRALLVEMAADISYALDNFTQETRRAQAETGLRRSLDEKNALLKEVHHRVKNNLQVITSLLRLEAGRTADDAAHAVLVEMQGRVMSMALLHETLYRSSDLANIDLAYYLEQLAHQSFRSLAPPSGITLHLDLSAAPIELDQAIPCGLLTNELLSNALKHGFPGGRPGVVSIRLHPGDTDGSLRLEVSDDGVGLPADIEQRRINSLGLHLVTVLAKQLQGVLEIGNGPGTTFRLVFTPRPASHAGAS